MNEPEGEQKSPKKAFLDARHQEWLEGQREDKQRSRNFSEAFWVSKLWVVALLIAPVLIIDAAEIDILFYHMYLALILSITLFYVRKHSAIGSTRRYVCNMFVTYGGMIFFILSAFAIAKIV